MGENMIVGPNYQRRGSVGTLPQQQKKKKADWCRENASLRQRKAALQRDAHQLFQTRSDLQQVGS